MSEAGTRTNYAPRARVAQNARQRDATLREDADRVHKKIGSRVMPCRGTT